MIIEEQQISIFDFYNQNNQYVLAQCISSDFAMGAGIAVQFNKLFNVKNFIRKKYIPFWDRHGYCLSILDYAPVLNLVTKENYFDKPTYISIKESLMNMKEICLYHKIKFIAIPRIGCGLDKLNWDKVKDIISDIFQDMDISIIICNI